MKYLERKAKPLPLWSKKIPYLKKNEIYSIYDISHKFKVKPNNIRMFFNRIGIKPTYKIILKPEAYNYYKKELGATCSRKVSIYSTNNMIKIYLDVRKNGVKKIILSEKQYLRKLNKFKKAIKTEDRKIKNSVKVKRLFRSIFEKYEKMTKEIKRIKKSRLIN